MSLYVISWLDKPDSAAIRQGARPAHLAYVQENRLVRFIVGGPFLSPEGAMIGSMLIVDADDPAKLDSFVTGDPYRQAGLYERAEVRPWKVTVGSLGQP
jgi:uncharacterized protein YciI